MFDKSNRDRKGVLRDWKRGTQGRRIRYFNCPMKPESFAHAPRNSNGGGENIMIKLKDWNLSEQA